MSVTQAFFPAKVAFGVTSTAFGRRLIIFVLGSLGPEALFGKPRLEIRVSSTLKCSSLIRKRYGHYDRRGKLKYRVSTDVRPAVVGSGTRIGDWEVDTGIGNGRQGALLTMVERKTLYTVIAKLPGKRADALADAAVESLALNRDKIKIITLDNGLEFAEHKTIAAVLKADIYFAHPCASWERGMNENTNGLIRQYFPKGTDFNKVTDEEIQFVMDRLNSRPRATRGGKSPNGLFLGRQVDLLAA